MDVALCRARGNVLLLENAGHCLAMHALVSGQYVLQNPHSDSEGGKTVETQRRRMYSGVTRFWVQIPMPPPTSVSLWKSYLTCLAFDVIICKTGDSKQLPQRFVGKVKKYIYGKKNSNNKSTEFLE